MLTLVVGCSPSSRDRGNGLGAGKGTACGWWERFEAEEGTGRGAGEGTVWGMGNGDEGWGMEGVGWPNTHVLYVLFD